ncbi:MAG: SGNH/GDSL hydrolase family protein [Gammaproteobacteria bacterium]|nr:SGNH/GDSL hydrolase family protein [Gammaproteobacteria bacterium]MDH3536053.1 SGNH/GDSL hydrolase family protein [Gammaproteobacteria bacterium]
MFACVYVVADVLVAQAAKRSWDLWDVQNIERNYRTPNELYHHDLVPLSDTVGIWGQSIYRIRTNSMGFKDSSTRQVAIHSDRYRILMIGDSFTEGVGLEFEKTFAGIAFAQFAQRGIEVLNAGVIGYSPSIYYRKIKYLLESVDLKIDEVVVFLDISDIADDAHLYQIDENDRVVQRPEFPDWGSGWTGGQISDDDQFANRIKHFLKTNSITIRLMDELKDRLLAPPAGQNPPPILLGGPRGEWTSERYFEQHGRPGLEITRQNMDRLVSLLSRHSVRLTVVVYPWPAQVYYGDLNSIQVAYWQDWAAQNQLTLVNLFPPFFVDQQRDNVLRDYYFPGDVHFNEAGNRLIAENFLRLFIPANADTGQAQ